MYDPVFFNSSGFYGDMGLISPFWGLADEISLKHFTQGQTKTASYYQVTAERGLSTEGR